MKSLSAASAVAVILSASVAFASVDEPNGLVVPVDSNNGETQLYTFFTSRGEGIDWIADAHTTPNQFSPLCGFTAEFLLNQSGSHGGLAWYNDNGVAPSATDLHTLVPPNSPLGTQFSGTNIKSDPAYTGGAVGFALIGGETHYTNPAYDNVCTNCSPAGPWITALIYASTLSPNAYYVCFEDGLTSASNWNNDGDFNDDVYFVTGVTCEGGGQPCQTGLSGICNDGITVCNATGTTCQPVNQATVETCNGLDDNCNGQVDEGAMCPSGQVCLQGSCVQGCGELGCTGNKVCSSGYCVDPECISVTCPSGQVCSAGTCKAPCDGVVCPGTQVCRVGRCVDPCVDVTCQQGQVCTQGVCVTGCGCQGCGSGTACDPATDQCVAPSCVGTSCSPGSYCLGGICIDDCANATCPSGQICSSGNCIDNPDAGSAVTSSSTGSGSSSGGHGSSSGSTGGHGSTGSGSSTGSHGSSGTSGSSGSSGTGGSSTKSGCGCGSGANGVAGFAAAAMVLAVLGRRRRSVR